MTPEPTGTPIVTPTPGFTGTFVIGDENAQIGNHVTFWGSHWAQHNTSSNGDTPEGFMGFAGSLSPNLAECGGTWRGNVGGGTNPPMMIPEFITAVASSSITRSGSHVNGDIALVVLIQTDSGYEPNPGHPGTGTIVGIVCGTPPSGDAFANISTRMRVETGDSVLIGGLSSRAIIRSGSCFAQ